MKGVCCILDSEEKYALLLTECLNASRLLPFTLRTYSDLEAYVSCSEENSIELLIVEEALLSQIDRDKIGCIIVLSESGGTDGAEDIPCVHKYQAVDKLVREIAAIYGDMGQERSVVREKSQVCLIGVYSPNGNCYKTTFCLALAYIMGRSRKVLYINLEEFSALGEQLQEGQYNLSDALYFYHIGERSVKLLSAINEGNEFDYISPVSAAEDLVYFTEDVLLGLIDRLVQLGGYEAVIMDVGSLVKRPWQLLGQLDYIYAPASRNRHEERRLMEFKKYLHNMGNDRLADNIREIYLPYDESIAREGKLVFSKALGGSFGKAVWELEV